MIPLFAFFSLNQIYKLRKLLGSLHDDNRLLVTRMRTKQQDRAKEVVNESVDSLLKVMIMKKR